MLLGSTSLAPLPVKHCITWPSDAQLYYRLACPPAPSTAGRSPASTCTDTSRKVLHSIGHDTPCKVLHSISHGGAGWC